jgi:16S rRNA processing protein RimM
LSSRVHQDHLIVSFEAIENPETAKTFVRQQLFLDRQQLPSLPADRYYWYQLEGLAVHSVEGADLGKVTEVYSNGPQDVLKTSLDHHIPFIRETIIKSIDLTTKVIVADFNPVYFEA